MSSGNRSLESQQAAIRAIAGNAGADKAISLRQRIALDQEYKTMLDLLAPRIRFLIRQYALADMQDDAEQACAIAVHRAIGEYDPEKASFSTFVTWKLRGELQGLRHRMRLDQRGSARRVGARTISMDVPVDGGSGEGSGGTMVIVDDGAIERVESAASSRMAHRFANRLLNNYSRDSLRDESEKIARRRPQQTSLQARQEGDHLTKPGTIAPSALAAMEVKLARERQIVASHLLGGPDMGDDGTLSGEQKRQVTRRVLRHVSRKVEADPCYAAAMSTVH